MSSFVPEHSKLMSNSSVVLCEAFLKHEQNRLSKSTKEHYLLVLVVLSSPEVKERRDTIRQTWMKGYRGRAQKGCS